VTLLKGLLCLLSVAAGSQRGIKFQRDWHLHVLPQKPNEVLLPTVCPNGTLYLASSSGRLVAISSNGQLLFDKHISQTRSLTCSGTGDLYLTSLNQLLIMQPSGSGELKLISKMALSFDTWSIAVANRRNIVVSGFNPSNGFPLHVLNERGRVIRSFGEGRASPDQFYSQSAQGPLLWDLITKRILFMPHLIPEVQLYNLQGDSLAIKTLGSLFKTISNRSFRLFANLSEQVSAERIQAASFLPKGDLLVQVQRRSPSGSLDQYLSIFDSNVDPVGVSIKSMYGLLAGVDANGHVFFLSDHDIVLGHFVRLQRSPVPNSLSCQNIGHHAQ